jgi:hypothetical protein
MNNKSAFTSLSLHVGNEKHFIIDTVSDDIEFQINIVAK